MSTSKKYTYPPSLSLLKFFWNAEAIRKNPIPYHHRFFEKYGETFSVRMGRKKYLLLSRDKEVVQYVLKKNHKNFYKSKIQSNYLSKYLGNGLLTSNGPFWLKQRRLIQPAFHKQKMEQLVSLMQETIESEISKIGSSQNEDVFAMMNEVAFKVIAKSLFSYTVSEEKLKRLQYIIEKVQVFLVKEVRLPHKGWWFKLSGQVAKHKALSEESRSILKEIIVTRKDSGEHHDDLLDMLLATRYEDTGEPMTIDTLIDEITILFVAGHETTANALTFTMYLLAKHPEIQQKVFSEVKTAETQCSNAIEMLGKLPYTRAVIDESMRLYPPAWITDRENLEDDTLGKHHIRKDTLVGISFYELHRHPAYWERPNDFWPERFLGEEKKKSAGIYYPFGAGPRMCIGLGFAIFEMQLTVAHIVKKYTLSSNKSTLQLNPLITLKPLNVFVSFTQR